MLVKVSPGCIRSDEQLIDQILTGARDDAEHAFEVLVKRHGPMVLGVCGHTLPRPTGC